MAIAKKSKPALRERIKNKWMQSSKWWDAGEWSARKAQLATKEYQSKWGGYRWNKKKRNLQSKKRMNG